MPKEYYKNADITSKNTYDAIFNYCKSNKVPIEEEPINYLVDYEIEKCC